MAVETDALNWPMADEGITALRPFAPVNPGVAVDSKLFPRINP